MNTYVNDVTDNLGVYPMEKLFQIKESLLKEGKEVFDFGIGDPKLPIASFITNGIKNSVSETLGYPSIRGTQELYTAHENFLKRRYKLKLNPEEALIVPSRGSKEAIFHVALSLVGRSNKKTIAYPSPGYPVYRSSALFSGAKPYPVFLKKEKTI